MAVQTATPLLEARGLSKQFGSFFANDGIDLSVYVGEVHALLGENGAGKSTLMKSLYGYHQPSAGEIWLDGSPARIESPQDGRRQRIGMVFQHFRLIPAMTVIDNIALYLPDLGMVLNRREIEARVREMMERYHLDVDPHAYVIDLAMGERQKVEILKILLGGARILIFDEPTSVLAPHEVEGLFRVFSRLRQDGYAILFITHKLPEVMATADRITVLRRGKVAGSLVRGEAGEREIVSLMLGIDPPRPAQRRNLIEKRERPLLQFEKVIAHDPLSGIGLKEVGFDLYPGEILGVAGVSGNGQREIGDAILGLRTIDSGRILLNGQEISGWPTERVLASEVACIPEDPLHMAAVPSMTVTENMALGRQDRYARWRGLAMNWIQARDDADRHLNTTFVSTPPGLDVLAHHLSGGNLQRVIIARELSRNPRLLLAYYPARGLDISNAEAMRRLLLSYRRQGTGILLVSEDLDELFALCDRLLVMYHGRIVADFEPQETDAESVGHLMTGG